MLRGFRPALLISCVGVAIAASFALAPVAGRADTTTFGATYVDTTLAGGEPFVIYSHAGKDLVYAAHEGTTHIDRTYVGDPDSSCDILPPKAGVPSGYACDYNNHINQWYSTDGGATWTFESVTNNPLYGSSTLDTGFSDPSLTEDAPPSSGSNPQLVYDTGIDLANDALYASADGGQTWGGTADCTEGDRPWLAGGQNGEVFLATDLEAPAPTGVGTNTVSGHAYFHALVQETTVGSTTTVTGILCDQNAISDPAGGDAQDYCD
ncbi:MAG: exo-alpha-sialidase, partial [Candidatus Dormibacteraeota bacterium]|nr:exo-alpha-sialidase [Candidatus Dormibacteraeota bacterium]